MRKDLLSGLDLSFFLRESWERYIYIDLYQPEQRDNLCRPSSNGDVLHFDLFKI